MLNTQVAMTPPPVDERGFTFIEVLIVIAIFSVGVLAVAVMQVTAIHTNTSARLSGEATALAANQLESLMTLDYGHADLNPGSHEITEGAYTVSWIVTDTDIDENGINDSKSISVTVQSAHPNANDVQIQYIIPEV